jgi:hypothetical protein
VIAAEVDLEVQYLQRFQPLYLEQHGGLKGQMMHAETEYTMKAFAKLVQKCDKKPANLKLEKIEFILMFKYAFFCVIHWLR